MVASRIRSLRPPLVLTLDLSRPVSDEAAPNPIAKLTRPRRASLRTLVETVSEAADDPRVVALLARVDDPAQSWAHAEEVRDAVTTFRRSGKPAVAHAQSFGEVGNGTLAYYVACAFDTIQLQPSGEVEVLGVAAEVPFVADLLDKLDVVAEVDRRHEYKSAADLLTERSFTDAHREAVDRIVASHHEQLLAAIAEGRGLPADDAAAFVDRGWLAAGEAAEHGLVDSLAYRDEAVSSVKAAAGDDARLVTVDAYRAVRRWRRLSLRRRTRVALVHGEGQIVLGRSRRSLAGPLMGADTVVAGFRQAVRDRRVRAIIFRVDSPGGSAAASDAVWRAVVRARAAGKPVIVSMGSVAGSGGYWVSMAADRILASAGTLTGSIGVVFAKFVVRGLRERLGITVDEAHRGDNALLRSSNERLSEEQWAQIGGFLDRVYDEFVEKAAAGRSLDRDRVHQLARGRVWTGADAAAHGLVDEVGGYRAACAAVREAIGLDVDAPLRLRLLPRQRLVERLGLRQPDPDDVAALRSAGRLLRRVPTGQLGAARMPDWVTRLR